MIKGNQKGQAAKYVGFTLVTLKAINPTKAEQNKLLAREDGEDDKEVVYLTENQEGKDKLRLSFWLHDKKLDKYFVYSIPNFTNKERVSRDGKKNQYINSTCDTSWTDNEALLPDWFTHFMNEEGNELGKKKVRKALIGEEELAGLIKMWLGRMKWKNPECEVMIDSEKLMQEDYSELRELINSRWDTPFVALTGVRTDENDTEKQYQQVYKKFLPADFMKGIEAGLVFKDPYQKKQWEKYEKDVLGDFGFSAYFDLVPIKEYDPAMDPATAVTAKTGVTTVNSKY